MSTTPKHLAVLALATLIGGVRLAASESTGDAAVATPTFTKDVAPILQDKCEACHRPDSMAPMSLVSYEETRPWVRAIRLRVSRREMPPWHIDKAVGIQHFQNDRSLSDVQIDRSFDGSTGAHRRATRGTCRRRSSGRMCPSGILRNCMAVRRT